MSRVRVVLQEVAQGYTPANIWRRVFRIGRVDSGELQTIPDLENALFWAQEGSFPRTVVAGYWLLQHFIVDPRRADVIWLAATLGTARVFSRRAFREEAVRLISTAIDALDHGGINPGSVGSDNTELSEGDLAWLHHAEQTGQTRGYFTLTGVIYQ